MIGPVNCPINGGSGPKVGAISAAGPAYLFNPDGTSCYGQSSGQDNALQTDFAAGTGQVRHARRSRPSATPRSATSPAAPSFLVPAAGVIRALDLAVNEYQGGQDFVAAWDAVDRPVPARLPVAGERPLSS